MLLGRLQALSEPGVDERLGRSPSSDGQSLLEDRWGLIAAGGGGHRGEGIQMFSGTGTGWKWHW